MEANDPAKPQVLLDVNVIQVGHSFVRQMGTRIPNSFSMFNIPANALQSLGGQNIQDLINQLIANGGINAATQQSIAALLAQLQNQQQSSSIFSQPVATFGGGLTFFGVTLGNLTTTFKLDETQVQSLEHVTLHASHGTDATMMVGSRIPILNASYAPAFNSSAISQVLGNQTYQPAFPSFNYEDVGLKLKAKPFVHATDVTMDLEVSIRTLSGNSLNGVPVIANREYKGQITVKDGEQAVVAGAVDRSEIKSKGGIPVLGQIPGLSSVTANNNRQETDDELLIVITPHIMSAPSRGQGPEIWMAPAK
jgi:type II secretory pathway component GspD/PulD (secretin)